MPSVHHITRSHARFLDDLAEMRSLVLRISLARRATSVSAWSIGQHLEHLLLTDNAILDGLTRVSAASSSTANSGRPTLTGYAVLVLGRIPRGRAKAPTIVVPHDGADADRFDVVGVTGAVATLEGRVMALAAALPTLSRSQQTVPHPLLGHFNPSQWLRFATIHNRHHLAIIRDIERTTA